mmetsp:Transcript_33549/g.95481  ORF Transcript_33549/g.95481 Transcript_33549/m.95481 type:complete len:235 (-) Transcript_33549:1268-1972(-)
MAPGIQAPPRRPPFAYTEREPPGASSVMITTSSLVFTASNMRTKFGCARPFSTLASLKSLDSWPSAGRSQLSRPFRPNWCPLSPCSRCSSVFTATSLPLQTSLAWYTSPKCPAPSLSNFSYRDQIATSEGNSPASWQPMSANRSPAKVRVMGVRPKRLRWNVATAEQSIFAGSAWLPCLLDVCAGPVYKLLTRLTIALEEIPGSSEWGDSVVDCRSSSSSSLGERSESARRRHS